jgi:methylmalonyl-CoA mutase N-terminal domain/subunit
MSTNSYDEAISIPTEEAARVAVKTQRIIEHEIGITDIVDPLGGSYYVEYLTNEIEKGIWKYLDTIEEMGGYCAAVENGYLEMEQANASIRYQRELERGEKVIVGVNKYVEPEAITATPFRYNPKVREIAAERLRRLREERDNTKVAEMLDRIREAAQNGGDLMPLYVEAAKAYATLGEIMAALKDVFGAYQFKSILATV